MGQPRHKYDYKVSPHAAGTKVVRMVGEGKNVLELGSGPGAITRLLKDQRCNITALELDVDAINIVSEYCKAVYPCDLNSSSWPEILPPGERFEVIVAGDVLEHLYDPWRTLQALHPLLTHDGSVVISLPHVGHNSVLSCLINGNFEYQPWGLLDKTHVRFFGIKDIQRLFNNAGFKIIEADFVVKTPEQTEFAKSWRQLPIQTQEILGSNRFGTIYQVVVKAVPKTSIGKSLDLTELAILPPPREAYTAGAKGNRLLGFFISHLSLRTRKSIARHLEKIGFRF